MKEILKKLSFIGLLAAATGAPAHAGLVGEIGTTGAGAHVSVPVGPAMHVRLGTGRLGYTYKGSVNELDFDFKLKGKTYDVLVDWHPMENSLFRLTGGLAYNGNVIDGRARTGADGTYRIGGNRYSAATVGSIDSRVDFNKAAPYLGIGWGRPSSDEKGWSFSSDIGVLFQGPPKSTLTSSGCRAEAAACTQLATDLARENAELDRKADKLKFYPVLRVGIGYKF